MDLLCLFSDVSFLGMLLFQAAAHVAGSAMFLLVPRSVARLLVVGVNTRDSALRMIE
jgi:hypothetical protein